MPQFAVVYEANATTSAAGRTALDGRKLGAQEAAFCTSLARAHGLLPDGVLQILDGQITAGEPQTVVRLAVLVDAPSELAAVRRPPPADLLCSVAGAMATGQRFELGRSGDRRGWAVDDVYQMTTPISTAPLSADQLSADQARLLTEWLEANARVPGWMDSYGLGRSYIDPRADLMATMTDGRADYVDLDHRVAEAIPMLRGCKAFQIHQLLQEAAARTENAVDANPEP